MLETAVNDHGMPKLEKAENTKLRVLWLSHVFHRKGAPLAIDAFSDAYRRCGVPIELILIGDGPALDEVRGKANASSARTDIKVLGAVPYKEVQRHMLTADIFLFTSVQDTSGNVILEAMCAALPVVAIDHQGAQSILRNGGGVLVPVADYDQTRSGIADAIIDLANNQERRQSLGREARIRVLTDHSWSAKRLQVVKIYQDIIGNCL
jgi:glycosyltransferase involved in cell wall biosynthesis